MVPAMPGWGNSSCHGEQFQLALALINQKISAQIGLKRGRFYV